MLVGIQYVVELDAMQYVVVSVEFTRVNLQRGVSTRKFELG